MAAAKAPVRAVTLPPPGVGWRAAVESRNAAIVDDSSNMMPSWPTPNARPNGPVHTPTPYSLLSTPHPLFSSHVVLDAAGRQVDGVERLVFPSAGLDLHLIGRRRAH